MTSYSLTGLVPVQSPVTAQENYVNCEERDGRLSFDSTADQSITSVSTVSAVSSRPVITRQGIVYSLPYVRKKTHRDM